MKIKQVPPAGEPDVQITLSFDEYLTMRLLQYCYMGGGHPTRRSIQRAFDNADRLFDIDRAKLAKNERKARLG